MGTTILPNTESRTDLRRKSAISSPVESRQVAYLAACVAESKKANATVVLDVGQVTLIADFFVFTGAESKAQVKAITEEVKRLMDERFGRKARAIEGLADARWVLIDYGDVIIHILQEKERDYYKLEQFWNHALVVDREEWANSDNLEVEH